VANTNLADILSAKKEFVNVKELAQVRSAARLEIQWMRPLTARALAWKQFTETKINSLQ
jgi:hypothetical protein